METVVVDDTQRDRILAIQEGHFADHKAIEIQPAKLSRSVSGLANADGGELYVGVTNDGRWLGFPSMEAANGHIQLLETLFPLGHGYTATFLSNASSSGLVLQIAIHKSRAVIKASNGTPYVRRGAQNLPVDKPSALQVLERNKGISSFENELLPNHFSMITDSDTAVKFILDVVPTTDPEPWMRKQQLIQHEKPTVCGVLLFADLPQATLAKRSGIKIYRYQTDRTEGAREELVGQPETLEGCMYDVIRAAVSRTISIINDLRVLGPEGPVSVQYPPEALHEVITNAVIHRDYSIADDVHIRIFENRVEVESPGRLPGHITPTNILVERFSRNGNLVRLINKFPDPPNKDVRESLNTAFAAMKRLSLRDPIIEERENSVVVYIRHERLASAEDLVLEYLRTNPSISNPIARKMTGIASENAVKMVFYRLRDSGLLQRVPNQGGNKAAWQLTKKGKLHNIGMEGA